MESALFRQEQVRFQKLRELSWSSISILSLANCPGRADFRVAGQLDSGVRTYESHFARFSTIGQNALLTTGFA